MTNLHESGSEFCASEEECAEEFSITPEDRVYEKFYNSLLPTIVEKLVEEGENISQDNSVDWMESESSIRSNILKNVVVSFKNGNIYCGTALGRWLHGEGEFQWADGTSFEGSFNKSKLVGSGSFSYPNGATYNGQVSYGHRHGKGNLTINELKYSGSFKDGLFDGQGQLESNGQNFEGLFLHHKPHFGKRIYENGIFVGTFDEFGSRKYGKFLFKNNDSYEGNWYEDQYNDFGVYKWNTPGKDVNKFLAFTSPTYTGYWLDGKRHGIGMLEFDERIIFCGWKYDKKTGPGFIMAANGEFYVSDKMFCQDRFIDGRKIIQLKEAKPLIENLIYYFNPKKKKICLCKCCKIPNNPILITQIEILKNKIKELMTFTNDKNSQLIPIFFPKYSVDFEDSIVLKFVQNKFKPENENQMKCIEIKCMNQVIVDNLKRFEMMFYTYSTLGIDTQRKDVILTRLGLWQMYRDIFVKIPEINVSSLIDEVEFFSNIFVHDSQNPHEKVYFFQFLKHIMYIVMKLHEDNFARIKVLEERYSFFGYFGTMLIVFLREVQSKATLTFQKSLFMIKEESKIAQKLLENLKNFEEEPTIRTLFRFYKKYSEAHSSDYGPKGKLKLIDNTLFLQCAQEIFPKIMQDGIFIEINFRITLLEFLEILLKLFEADVFHRKLNIGVEFEKLKIQFKYEDI